MKSCSDRNLDHKIVSVISDMQDWFSNESDKFTSNGFTIFSVLWMDGTDKIECRHGEKSEDNTVLLYKSVFYDGTIFRMIETTNVYGTRIELKTFVKNHVTGVYEAEL